MDLDSVGYFKLLGFRWKNNIGRPTQPYTPLNSLSIGRELPALDSNS